MFEIQAGSLYPVITKSAETDSYRHGTLIARIADCQRPDTAKD
jgi:hypothetical protein